VEKLLRLIVWRKKEKDLTKNENFVCLNHRRGVVIYGREMESYV